MAFPQVDRRISLRIQGSRKQRFPPGQMLFVRGTAPGPVFFGCMLEALEVRIREGFPCLEAL